MGLFNNSSAIRKAQAGRRLPYFPAGFRGTVEITRTAKAPRSGSLIVEATVLETEAGEPKPGEQFVWIQSLKNPEIAANAIQGFCAAVLGKELDDAEFLETIDSDIDEAIESPEDNMFTGNVVHLLTATIKTGAGNDFTVHNWGG